MSDPNVDKVTERKKSVFVEKQMTNKDNQQVSYKKRSTSTGVNARKQIYENH